MIDISDMPHEIWSTEQWDKFEKHTKSIRDGLTKEERRIYDFLLQDMIRMELHAKELDKQGNDFNDIAGRELIRASLVEDYLIDLFGWKPIRWFDYDE